MKRNVSIALVSDIHYAGEEERQRKDFNLRVVANPLARQCLKAYYHFVWMRDPFAHSHLVNEFLSRVWSADLVVANGDFSCDTAFVGVSDDASFGSAAECLGLLEQAFGKRLLTTIGDHELGKTSLLGGAGGMRLESWSRTINGLNIRPFWTHDVGPFLLMGVTSTLVALPVYEPEALAGEIADWRKLRELHLDQVRKAFDALHPTKKVILFCHDPTALPFLLAEESVRERLAQIERTVVGHLHTPAVLSTARLLAGMPTIRFLGNAVRRMTGALNNARCWSQFKVLLCPSLSGIELLKDGGFYLINLDLEGRGGVRFDFQKMPRTLNPRVDRKLVE